MRAISFGWQTDHGRKIALRNEEIQTGWTGFTGFQLIFILPILFVLFEFPAVSAFQFVFDLQISDQAMQVIRVNV